MKEMTILDFLGRLSNIKHEMPKNVRAVLTKAALMIERDAKQSVGTYQDAAPPFAGWAELADSTKDDRVRKGFSENEPELRTGALRDSYGHDVEMTGPMSGEAVIGSNSDVAVWQELGTKNMPPRTIIGGAAVRQSPKVAALIGKSVHMALVGEEVFEGRISLK